MRSQWLWADRARDADDDGSDWDLGVYHRGTIDLSRLAVRGEVYPPGSWGRLMNGGAWLRSDLVCRRSLSISLPNR